MTTGSLADSSVGYKIESVYGTAVTVDRFVEFVDETFDYEKKVVQGVGLRVGSVVARSPRRVVTETSGKGDLTVEMVTKGLGTLLKACMGYGESNLSTGSTYQQRFLLSTGTTGPSLTLQKTSPRVDGTLDSYTWNGGVCDSFEIDCANGDIVKLKSSWIFRELKTDTAYATPSYVSSPNLFHFAQGAITVGGTVTAPTTTALATGGTAVANVRDFNVKVDNKLTADRFNAGGAGKMVAPTYGLRDISGKMTIEYDAQTMMNAFLADTELALSLTFTSTEAVTGGYATLQIVLPAIKLNGELPKTNGAELITQSVDFDVLDNLVAAAPMYIVLRTADTAL